LNLQPCFAPQRRNYLTAMSKQKKFKFDDTDERVGSIEHWAASCPPLCPASVCARKTVCSLDYPHSQAGRMAYN